VSHRTDELAMLRQQSRRFTEVAFALMALAALALALALHHAGPSLPLAEDARRVVTWSFLGLAACDAALLLSWQRIGRWIAGDR
jgi:hypothetical protein